MAERMAAKRVAAQQQNINRQNHCPNADTKMGRTQIISEPHRLPCVVRKDKDEQQRDIKKVAVNVLHDERKRGFARISFSRFADGARRWIGPERFIISATVIVTR